MSAPKILSVDDSRMIHTLINKGFSPYDVQMVFASNGAEGLEVAAREKPDVILLDVTMPVMDGVECLGKLKSNPELKDIPVIMLTAEAGKENVLKIAKMGVRDYIVKPFTEANVIDRVSRLVELKPKGAAAASPAPAASAAPAVVAQKKARIATDALKVLVVDEHPAIIETIAKALSKRGWQVVGSASPDQAQATISSITSVEDTPDAILVSLSYPGKAALKFFQSARSHAGMKNVPVMGLCVKTATFEMGEAKETGFVDVLTKPLDSKELPDRIARAMDLDITPIFYTSEGDCQILTVPQDLSETGSIDLTRQSRSKVAGFVDAGFGKLVIDLTGVQKYEIPLMRLLASVIHECNSLDIKWAIVGDDAETVPNLPTILASNQKVPALKDLPYPFKSGGPLTVYPNRAAAMAAI